MAFTKPPTESRKAIARAGRLLLAKEATPEEIDRAQQLVNQWRSCHAYPINTFQSTLKSKLRNYGGNSLSAQRLKRMPTIINKLERIPTMQVITMQDIGGVRAVMSSLVDVYKLADEYREATRFKHKLVKQKDYIQEPSDDDGYRSIHLIYRYTNELAPEYNGLLIELQIRTKLQHIWATAVETMGTLLGQALKSSQGDDEWLHFFRIVSHLFALKEGTPAVPCYSHLSRAEVIDEITRIQQKLGVFQKMRALTTATRVINSDEKTWAYHLIVLNSAARSVEVTSYGRTELARATADYENSERQASEGSPIEPVLVSAGPLQSIRSAYPNYFLDTREFLSILTEELNSR